MMMFIWATERFKLDLQSYECRAKGTKLIELDRTEIFTELLFQPKIVIKANGKALDRVQKQVTRALDAAQKYSLVANSVKSKITTEPTVEIIP
jgi:uncharacterized OsmC-like protein